ncbi:PilW family protein [Rhodanobacter sp. 7MK24]|uniref:PilW family protein n=1 Tax=Rhodanobacter sp. 7MK24 TaxID=2775922 RepID=UPI00177CA0A0|nr:PilW family protein [Rhodanobacter sp. 7MK24]MBD8879376.1 PilW family protein [Rhodanobacter sp. 7MK24]
MSRRLAKALAGFTLIELMVAMLLGLIVIGGVTSVFLANQQVYRTNAALGDVQDGTRMSFEMLAQNIREAGLLGCGNNGQVTNVLPESPANGGTAWWANWNNNLMGYGAGTAANPALTVGTATGNQVSGTDSLAVLSAADLGLSINTQAVSTTSFTLNGTSSDLAANKVMIVCDPWEATIFRASSYTSGAKPVIGYALTSGSTTDNTSTNLRPYNTVGGVAATYAANSPIATLAAGVWYIGYNPVGNGSTSLYLASVDTTTGAVTSQEMVRGVTAMSIKYNLLNTTSFVTASAVGASNWSSVVAVQISLTVQQTSTANAGVSANAGTYTGTGTTAAAAPIQRSYTITSTVRNRVN